MHSTFSRHRRENPEFDRFVTEATKDNNSRISVTISFSQFLPQCWKARFDGMM
jgi:hypothetical protein